jgi:hypothetical protein
LNSIRLLGEEGLDFLRLAFVLAVDAIPVRLVAEAFDRVDGGVRDGGRALRALDQADSLGLCTKDNARMVAHPSEASNPVRRRRGRTNRSSSGWLLCRG